jgi:hypothetical protein
MLKKLNYPLLCLLVLCARAVILGASIGDSIAICGLAALNGYLHYLKSQEQEPVNDQVRQEIAEIKSTVTALKLARSVGR